MKPTDDELIDRAKQVIQGNDKPTVILSRDKAAAMLRACKGMRWTSEIPLEIARHACGRD